MMVKREEAQDVEPYVGNDALKRIYGWESQTIKRLCDEGMPFIMPLSRRSFRLSEVEKWLTERTKQQAAIVEEFGQAQAARARRGKK